MRFIHFDCSARPPNTMNMVLFRCGWRMLSPKPCFLWWYSSTTLPYRATVVLGFPLGVVDENTKSLEAMENAEALRPQANQSRFLHLQNCTQLYLIFHTIKCLHACMGEEEGGRNEMVKEKREKKRKRGR